jgi:hypothetical protein
MTNEERLIEQRKWQEIFRYLTTIRMNDPSNANHFIAKRMQEFLPKKERDHELVEIAEEAIRQVASWIEENTSEGIMLMHFWREIPRRKHKKRKEKNYADHIYELAKPKMILNLAAAIYKINTINR